jgi:sugar phosphate isomerase/epimerase
MASTRWQLSGFGDEIDPDPVVQVATLQALGAGHIEVRSAWDTNVVDFTADQLAELKRILVERSMAVSAIASPVGKVDVTLPVEHEVTRLGRAITAAHVLDAPYIRIFSFFNAENHRDAVLERMTALTRLAEREDVVLLHENEKAIFGDVPARVLDLVESIGSERLRVAWDSANFVQVGVRPFTDGYSLLRPYLDYLQVKDAVAATGEVVPAGHGDGELRATLQALRDDGYSGFVSLEPHLVGTTGLGGFSGPAAFGLAARELRAMTDLLRIELA